MNNDLIELNNIDILEVAKPIKNNMNLLLSNIKNKLLLIPSVIEVIRSYYPTKTLQAILTKEQKADIANGLLEIMTSKDGKNLLATLRDPKTKKFDAVIPLKEVELTPELNKAITNFVLQFQLLQLSAEIKSIQKVVEEVRKGQEYDRLAVAYSCQQKFLQALQLEEYETEKQSLVYYGNFIKEKYLDVPNLLKRLDSIDPYVGNYWTKKVPDIKKRIERHNELIEIELKKQNELDYKLNLLEAK